MKPNNQTSILTFGELCEALAEEELPAAIEDGFYVVSQGDLKRFTRAASKDYAPMLFELLTREPVQVAS